MQDGFAHWEIVVALGRSHLQGEWCPSRLVCLGLQGWQRHLSAAPQAEAQHHLVVPFDGATTRSPRHLH